MMAGAIAATALTALFTVHAVTGVAEASREVDAAVVGDVLEVKGTNKDDQLVLRLKAGDDKVVEVDVDDDGSAEFSFDRSLFTEIEVDGKNGRDLVRIDEVNGQFVEPATLRGGNGDDTLLGGSAIDTMYGGNGDDFIDGNRANDVAFMGNGDDTFRWDPGDASDVIEGQNGTDALVFNGANGGETVDLSASGARFIFFRDPGGIKMDTNNVEISLFNALGGPDAIAVGDLSATDVARVDLNLDSGVSTGTGDGQSDRVTVDATDGDDTIVVTGSSGNVNVAGLSATVAIGSSEFANDQLNINTAAGDDSVDAVGLAPGVIQLFVDGQAVTP
jgi:Ca2+-binding RTX toxin-like protein